MQHTYRLYWLDGTTTDIIGTSFESAMEEKGYSVGVLKTLDYWELIK